MGTAECHLLLVLAVALGRVGSFPEPSFRAAPVLPMPGSPSRSGWNVRGRLRKFASPLGSSRPVYPTYPAVGHGRSPSRTWIGDARPRRSER